MRKGVFDALNFRFSLSFLRFNMRIVFQIYGFKDNPLFLIHTSLIMKDKFVRIGKKVLIKIVKLWVNINVELIIKREYTFKESSFRCLLTKLQMINSNGLHNAAGKVKPYN